LDPSMTRTTTSALSKYDFNEKVIYIKSYDSVLKHYIFANKQKLINEIMESLEIKFEIEDIKIKRGDLKSPQD